MKLPSQLLRPLLLQDLRSRRTYAAKAHEKPKRSSSQGGMAEWLVIIPDHDGVLEQRMGIRK